MCKIAHGRLMVENDASSQALGQEGILCTSQGVNLHCVGSICVDVTHLLQVLRLSRACEKTWRTFLSPGKGVSIFFQDYG
jgi:hypothetical protein